ncbi:MAG: extracellular solute-binding protein, partial [Verrucomicrobia bacterium]|nr:extracellular solute-binding protein [Verrucomicrobiota bacterium]
MKTWLLVIGVAVLLGTLWSLNPERAIQRDERNVTEIVYLGDAGPEAPSVERAMRQFEAEHPGYKIVSGQNASRDQTADPTRFLVSVAGGMPPDLILFDRYAVSEWAARGAFTKLDQFVAQEANNPALDAIRQENFYKSCWDEVVYENPVTHERGTYGVPERVDDR